MLLVRSLIWEGRLGGGAFSEVYAGVNLLSEEEVAIKLVMISTSICEIN